MLKHLLVKSAAWYRPTPGVDETNAEYLGDDVLKARSVKCSIQPATAKEIQFYSVFRSMEVSHSIFTDNPGPWLRNDVLVYNGRRFTVVGVRNLIELDRVWVLDCLEYQGASERQ